MNQEQKNSYQLGYLYIKYKPLLKKIGKYIIIGLIALLWLNLGIKFVNYIINISKTNQYIDSIATQQVNYDSLNDPVSIQIIETVAINHGPNNYDLLAYIKNPNNYWAAEIEYQFIVSGQSISPQTITIIPGQELFLTETNITLTGSISKEAQLKILNTNWQGLKRQQPEAIFEYLDPSYHAVEFSEDEESSSDSYTRLATTAINKNIYGFKNVKITVLLRSQGAPVGVGSVYLQNFIAGEKRTIEFNWPRKFPVNAEINFNAYTDPLNQDNLIAGSTIK